MTVAGVPLLAVTVGTAVLAAVVAVDAGARRFDALVDGDQATFGTLPTATR